MLPCFHESFHFAQSGKWYGGSGSGIKSISFHSDVVLSLEQLNLPIELLYCSRDIPMMDVLLLDLGLEGGGMDRHLHGFVSVRAKDNPSKSTVDTCHPHSIHGYLVRLDIH